MQAPANIGPLPHPHRPPEEQPPIEIPRSVYALLSSLGASPGIHIDSAAGQGLHCVESAFHGTLSPCRFRLDGIGGSDYITAFGTTSVLIASEGNKSPTHICVAHNQLYAPNAIGTVISSVSQIQTTNKNACHLDSNNDPYIFVDDVRFNLHLSNGLFMLPFWNVDYTDKRLIQLPKVTLCQPGPIEPPNNH